MSTEYDCFFCGKHYNLNGEFHCFWVAVQEEQGIPMGYPELHNKSEWRCCDNCAPKVMRQVEELMLLISGKISDKDELSPFDMLRWPKKP